MNRFKYKTLRKNFPLKFKIGDYTYREYIPRSYFFLDPVLNLRARWLSKITGNISYFHLRHGYTPEGRKELDLAFVMHYIKVHHDKDNASPMEKLRYKWYWWKYGTEIIWVIEKVRRSDINDRPKDVGDYIDRWKLGAEIPPILIEYLHGMDGSRWEHYSYLGKK